MRWLLTLTIGLWGCLATSSPGRHRKPPIDRPCPPAEGVPICNEGVLRSALDIAQLTPKAKALENQAVSVRGVVGFTAICLSANACGGGAGLYLAKPRRGVDHGSPNPFDLHDVRCSGRETRMCCSHQLVSGQQIIARGRLKRQGINIHGPYYTLLAATLCKMPPQEQHSIEDADFIEVDASRGPWSPAPKLVDGAAEVVRCGPR